MARRRQNKSRISRAARVQLNIQSKKVIFGSPRSAANFPLISRRLTLWLNSSALYRETRQQRAQWR
jgi:hypothetical protein